MLTVIKTAIILFLVVPLVSLVILGVWSAMEMQREEQAHD